MLFPTPTGMTESAQIVGAVAVLMATWWISEALPFAITALLPVILFPVFGVMEISQVTPAYANHVIFLFFSGFIFALCLERWQLHKRIALHTINSFGFSYHKILLGFMVTTAFLSMWVSNTATALMMIPIAVGVASQMESNEGGENQFSVSLLLGIAYAASIGGVATLIGTPPNAILAGIIEQQTGHSIGFFEWMTFAFPLATIFLLIAWLYLKFLIKDKPGHSAGARDSLGRQLDQLPPLSREEKLVIGIFSSVCVLWVLRGLIDIELFKSIKDATIGLIGAVLLFIIPASGGSQRLMDWKTAKKLPWDILILFGGGFALASGFEQTELTQWLGLQFSFLQGVNVFLIIFVITVFVIFLTEITSNTATASLLIPLMIALSLSLDMPPLLLATAVAVATSYAFMLPVATPPNAIIFSTGRVPIQKMAKTGLLLNIMGSVLITLFVTILAPWVLL